MSKYNLGFTLYKFIFFLVFIIVAAFVASLAFSDSGSTGKKLYSIMKKFGSSAQRFHVATGCYPKKTIALFNQSAGLSSNDNYCGQVLTKATWSRFHSTEPTNTLGNVKINQIKQGATLSLGRTEGIVANGNENYYVKASHLSKSIAKAAYKQCGGSIHGSNNTSGSKTIPCKLSSNKKSIYYVYAEGI